MSGAATTAADRALAELRRGAAGWRRTAIPERMRLLRRLRDRTLAEAEQLVAVAAAAKGYPVTSPWAAEDWAGGPWALLQHAAGYHRTLHRLHTTGSPVPPGVFGTDTDGRTTVRVFPETGWDRMLLNGLTARVRLRPDVPADQALRRAGSGYRHPAGDGEVAVVLGAGNVAAITPLDMLHQLYGEGRVVAAKLNPVNGYLAPSLRRIFADFIAAGWVRLLDGGAELGDHLARHEQVDAVHLTGSARTYQALMWGDGEAGRQRMREGRPRLRARVTSELGGVSPCIVVPGAWRAADFRHHAALIATSKLNNGGHNCIATQVLVVPAEWDGTERLLAALRSLLRRLPPRPGYYPGTATRLATVRQRYPAAESLGAGGAWLLADGVDGTPEVAPGMADDPLLDAEVFATALGVVRIPASDTGDYLRRATDFANRRLPGTLGASLLVSPETARRYRPQLDAAVRALRFGVVGVNVWSGVGFFLGSVPWGGFAGGAVDPGAGPGGAGSGVGMVHNTMLLEQVEQTILVAPFAPFPRGLLTGSPSLSPAPPYHVGNRTGLATVRRMTRFTARPGAAQLPGIFASALRG